MGLTGLPVGTGSDPFLPCVEKDVLLPEYSRDLLTSPDLRLEPGSLLLELGSLLPPILLTLVFREEFSLPVWRVLVEY